MKNWLWISGNLKTTKDEWKWKLENIKKSGISAIFIKDYFIQDLLTIAKEFELEIHVWIISLLANSLELPKVQPEWFNKNRNLISSYDSPPYVNYYKWLCPNKKETYSYLKNKITNILKNDINGIHLDYIRYPDVILPEALQPEYQIKQDCELPEYDFCYCEKCRESFEKKYGIDPLALAEPEKNIEWRNFRLNSVTKIVNNLQQLIEKSKPKKYFSAAVFPTPSIAKKLVRQDWTQWKLDGIFPMIYHHFYNQPISWIKNATEEGLAEIDNNTDLYSGLYVQKLSPKELITAIEFSLKANAKGVSLFCEDSMTNEHWKALKSVNT